MVTHEPEVSASTRRVITMRDGALRRPRRRNAGSLDDIERLAIARALRNHSGNRTKAAAELGVSRRTILNKIEAYGLE